MAKIRTHYDNLKVSRDAPDAVIRAAYKALLQRYHPDKDEPLHFWSSLDLPVGVIGAGCSSILWDYSGKSPAWFTPIDHWPRGTEIL